MIVSIYHLSNASFHALRRYAGAVLALFVSLLTVCACVPDNSTAQQPGSAASRIEWIDVHVHLLGGGGPRGADYPGAVRAAIAAMDEAGIKKSVVLPPPQVSGGRLPFDWKDFREALQAWPGRFAFLGGGGLLNPMLQDAGRENTVDEATRRRFADAAKEIRAAGAVGFGEIAAHHLSFMGGHPYESVPADHPLFLLLADIAARYDVVIDLHFDLVTEDMPLPPRLSSPSNPPKLQANIAGFERLLAHNRQAKIVWAHAGSDPLGNWTASLSRDMLRKHPNLSMSLRLRGGMMPGGGPPPGMQPPGLIPGRPRPGPARPGGMMQESMSPSMAFSPAGEINPEWLKLLREFPDRFVIGGDQFIASPQLQGVGPGLTFAAIAPVIRERTRQFLVSLPPDVARKVAYENAMRLYKLPE